ncbi:MAG: STAS domain-containing protein [Terracidiphilus sp.]|jgi:anti-anti-sigma factor
MFKECRFIKANGLKCQSPALRGSPFCYFHARTRVVVPRRPRRPKEEAVNLPVLSDPADVLAMINEILQRVASNTMSPRRAGSLLYALQMARQNFEDGATTATLATPTPQLSQTLSPLAADPPPENSTEHKACRFAVESSHARECPMPVSASIGHHDDGCAVVTLTGPITLGSSLSLAESQVRSLINSGVHKIVLDLSRVDYIDSAGLGMLIYIYGSLCSRGGALRLCGVAPRITELLVVTKTNALLVADATLSESLAALKA